MQHGSLIRSERHTGPDVWEFRWREFAGSGKRKHRRIVLGSVEHLVDEAAALSPKGARGIWQFMPDTARRYGLEVTVDRDERIEVVKSTRAAAHYLRNLYQRCGDWRMAFAAYNAGEQVVEHTATRTGHTDFSRIERALPAETRNYVPAVMRAMELLGSSKQEVLPLVRSGKSPVQSGLYASTESADRCCGTKNHS